MPSKVKCPGTRWHEALRRGQRSPSHSCACEVSLRPNEVCKNLTAREAFKQLMVGQTVTIIKEFLTVFRMLRNELVSLWEVPSSVLDEIEATIRAALKHARVARAVV